MRRPKWTPGDLDFPTRLKPQKGGGGAWVYLTKEHIAFALTGKPDGDVPDISRLSATRTPLDPGTHQVLIRIRED